MSYRDDHDAALARVAALERQLARRDADEDQRDQAVATLQRELATARTQRDRLAAQLADVTKPEPPPLPTWRAPEPPPPEPVAPPPPPERLDTFTPAGTRGPALALFFALAGAVTTLVLVWMLFRS